MKQLTSLLPEALRQEIYALWEVRLCKHGICCFLAMCFKSGMLCPCAGIWNSEQRRGPAGETVWPAGDDPAGARVWGAGGNTRKTAGVLWLHSRYVSSTSIVAFTHFSTRSDLAGLSLGRFHHPDVLQLVSSMNKERESHMTNTDGTKTSEPSQAADSVPEKDHTTSHASWL